MFEKAKKFCLEQRIKELKNAIEYWPHSEQLFVRKQELSELEDRLEEINKKLLSS